jgi:class 3 adenylate cyclase
MTDETKPADAQAEDIESYLAQREQMESLFQEKYTRILTVVFTDLKGSTSIAETEGDLVSRMLIKQHNDIVLPAIKDNNGVFVKSIGDGTLSYFENALDAVRAAVRIQKGMDALNMSGKFKIPVLMRVGMHTGKCIVEKSDIFGDTVNTASRFESSANPGEIYLSEDTYNALTDRGEVYCRFVRQITLKGKKEPFNAYKAFWNPLEIEKDMTAPAPAQAAAPVGGGRRLALWLVAAVAVVVLLTIGARFLAGTKTMEERRTIEHSISR